MKRERQECASADAAWLRDSVIAHRLVHEIGGGSTDRAPTSIGQRNDEKGRTAAGADRHDGQALTAEGVARLRHGDVRHQPIDDGGSLRCSGIRW